MLPIDDRYRWYGRMRAEAPVHRHPDGYWAVFTYNDVRSILADHATFSSDPATRGTGPALVEPVVGGMLMTDPPRHDRLRALVLPAFAPRSVDALRDHTVAVVGELLDEVGGQGAMDVVGDFAYRLPAMTIARLLGVPERSRDQFLGWTHVVLATQASGVGGPAPADLLADRLRLRNEMDGFFAEIIESRRGDPGDDLVTTLVTATAGDDPLTPGELLDFCRLLLFAGHATTMNLIANAVIALEEWPQVRDRLRADPSWFRPAVEEVLRYRSPIQRTMRFARRRVELGGEVIEAGDRVVPYIGSANRDPQRFDHPDVLDIERRPNPHVGFGHGIHFCVGAPLARLEAPIALRMLLDRFPDLHCDLGGLQHLDGVSLHGVQRLPAEFTPSPPVRPVAA